MSAPLLRVDALDASYPASGMVHLRGRSVQVLHGISLSLERGETLAVVGESGSGKSTLAKVLTGLHPARAGTMHLDGIAIDLSSRRWPAAIRKRVQMVFQNAQAALNPHLRVDEIVAEPLQIHHVVAAGQRADRVRELMADVGLPMDLAKRYPHQLSGGQQQRVGIARALALRPDLLVLDEPVSALDISVQAQVLNLLAQLQQRHGLAYLFISHDMTVVRHLADRVAVMQAGRVVEQGTCTDVLEHAAHPYTQALLRAVPGHSLPLPPGGSDAPTASRCTRPSLTDAAISRLALYHKRLGTTQ